MDIQAFGSRVARLRKYMGWTQDELAELVGVSRQQVQNWEYGRKGTTTKRLLALYEVFGVTPEQFWDLDYLPGGLWSNNGDTSAHRTVVAGVPDVDERQRALRCPRCSSKSYNDDSTYCYKCAFPMYNLCSKEKHINPAIARFCGQCGSKTFWAMTEEELIQAGVPPLQQDGHSTHSNK